MIGYILALISSILCAIYCRYSETLKISVIAKLLWQFIIAIPLLIILFNGIDIQSIISISIYGWIKIFLLGSIVSLGGYGFWNLCIKHESALKNGILDYLEAIFSLVISIILFIAFPNLIQIIGFMLIMLSIYSIRWIK